MSDEHWGTWALLNWAALIYAFVAQALGWYGNENPTLIQGLVALNALQAARHSHLYFKDKYGDKGAS